MHFFNPVPAMKLVEVIAGGNTPAELVEKIKTLSTEIGKTPVVVNEAPGFVVNKILIPYCNEGVCVLQEGVASAEDIDIAMQLGCNHPCLLYTSGSRGAERSSRTAYPTEGCFSRKARTSWHTSWKMRFSFCLTSAESTALS